MKRFLLGLVLVSMALVPTVASAQAWGPYYRHRGPYYAGYRGYGPYGYYRPPVPYYVPRPYPVYPAPVYPAPVYPAPGYGVGVGVVGPGFGVQFGS